MSDICPYCGTRSPGSEVCRDCGGILDDLSMTATQIAMGPWYFRVTGKPWAPGCSLAVLRRMMQTGKIKPGSQIRGPATGQLWRRAENIPGIAHLTGRCHECYADVDPGARSCFGCGIQFPTLTDENNRLGLPDDNVAEHVQQQRKLDPQTCPRCATHMESPAVCDHCDAIFDPPAEATAITLGTWFYRSNATAYFPGIGFDRVVELIGVGAITSQTIMRGPTTEQFWTLAKSIEGIAHHVGFCHACEAEVDKGATSCRACGTVFIDPPKDDQLGLRFKTPDEVDAAQKELDAELAKIAASQPASSVAPAVQARTSRSAQSEYELYDEAEQYDEHDEYAHHDEHDVHADHHEHDHWHDEHDQEHDHHAHAEHDHHDDVNPLAAITDSRQRGPSKRDHLAGHLESVASGMDDEPAHHDDHDHVPHTEADEQTLHDEPAVPPQELAAATGTARAPAIDAAAVDGAPGSSAGDAKVRRQKSQLEQNQTKLAVVALVSVLMLVGVVVLIIAGSGDLSNSNNSNTNDSANNNKDRNTNTNTFASQAMTDLRNKAEEQWKIINTVQRTQAFRDLLTQARDNMVAAREQYGNRSYAEAEQSYNAAIKAMDAVEDLLEQRTLAQHTSRRAVAAKNTAGEFDVEKLAGDLWKQAGDLLEQAETAMREERFADASTAYESAVETFGKATLFVQHMREASDARASIAADIKKRYDDAHLAQFGGEPWQRISAILKKGDDYAEQKQFGLAMESFGKVRAIFPQLDIVMRRGLGRRFYAYRTGRVTAELIALKWKGQTISDQQFKALKQLYADLQLPPTFVADLPTASDITPNDFAKTLRDRTMAQLAAQFTGDKDKAVITSYRIGVNVSIVEQLIDTELGPLNLRTKGELRLTLKRLRELLAEADWNRRVTGLLNGFESVLNAEKDGSDETRTAWKEIVSKLDMYKTGHPLTQPDA